MLPLGRDRIVSSESHVACHATSKGMAKMGVSSSSGHTRERCFWRKAVVNVLAKMLGCKVVCFYLIYVVYCFV